MNEEEIKQGDRVQVTLVGSVQVVGSDAISIRSAGLYRDAYVLPESIEKLEDPEPTWIFGDVVKVQGYYPFTRRTTGWSGPGVAEIAFERIVARAWERGELQILYKANA